MEGHLNGLIDQVIVELDDPDVAFSAGFRCFMVHKKVLEKSSPVLKGKLSDTWRTFGDVLELDEEYVEPEVVEELLIWLYYLFEDKKPECTIENAYSLCVAAHYLMITELIAPCCEKLCGNITPESVYDLFTISNHFNLDDLRKDCYDSIREMPDRFLLSPQVVKWKAQELKMFIEKWLEADDSYKIRDKILSSLFIWVKESFEDRLGEMEQLLKLISPETLSSNALFRFMKTDLYSKLDEHHRKQYYVRSYLPTGISSTDKLYCISRRSHSKYSKVHCLDLSAGDKWVQPISKQEDIEEQSVFGVSWRKNIYFFATLKFNPIEIFQDISNESDKLTVFGLDFPLNRPHRQKFAGAVLGDCVYTTVHYKPEVKRKIVHRYNVKNKEWKAIQEMQTARLKHQLVALKGFLYAIGGEVLGPTKSALVDEINKNILLSYFPSTFEKRPKVADEEKKLKQLSSYHPGQVPGPERYNPRADRWEYIAPSNYHHKCPTAVAHEGRIYVLSQDGFECYSPKDDRWTQLPAPDVCRWPALVSIAGRLWLLTELSEGVYSSDRTPNISRLVYEFDVVKQEWTRLPDMPEGDYTGFSFVIKQ